MNELGAPDEEFDRGNEALIASLKRQAAEFNTAAIIELHKQVDQGGPLGDLAAEVLRELGDNYPPTPR